MSLRKIITIIICAVITVHVVSCKKTPEKPAVTHDAEISEGNIAADAWIKLIDEGKYSESWKTASALFKKSLTDEKWKELITSARGNFGKNLDRSIASKEYVKELPGVPDGEYVIYKYRSSFEKKKNSIEVITVMKDADGKWRGAGYTIK